jgi:hypothetical protein
LSPLTVTVLRLDEQTAAEVLRLVAGVRSGRVSGCRHLEHSPVAVGCVMHPGTVRCLPCAEAHTLTHTAAEEHDCDRCAGPLVTEDEHPAAVLVHTVEVDALVPIGRGRHAAVGVLVVGGYGLCAGCRGVAR